MIYNYLFSSGLSNKEFLPNHSKDLYQILKQVKRENIVMIVDRNKNFLKKIFLQIKELQTEDPLALDSKAKDLRSLITEVFNSKNSFGKTKIHEIDDDADNLENFCKNIKNNGIDIDAIITADDENIKVDGIKNIKISEFQFHNIEEKRQDIYDNGLIDLSNIQSISVDPHKYGLSPKGSSVLLWKDREMKKYQYFVASDWTGGLYASVSLPGSRVGAQIATTWAAILFNGNANYKSMSRKIKGKTISFAEELRQIPNFEVIGWPNVNVVAFYNTKYSIGQLSKYLKRQNWNLNILQNPICLHICITPKNIKYIDMLLLALNKFNQEEVKENKDDDMTAIYGMAAEIPDKNIITELINYYLDMTTNI